MPRKSIDPSSEHPYHVTARCINRETFDLPLPRVWEVMSEYLYLMHHLYSLKIHSFVLMPNHFHLIARTPLGNLAQTMNYFMRETSRVIGFEANRINQIWGGPHHKSLIKTDRYFDHAYKYVYRNPVESGLSKRVECYPYSTLNALVGISATVIPIEQDLRLVDDVEGHLEWLNRSYKRDHHKVIRSALRKRLFQLTFDHEARKPHELEQELS